MKKTKIEEMLRESKAENFNFNFSDFVCDDFIWVGTKWNEETQEEKNFDIWETVNITEVQLHREQIEYILESNSADADANAETYNWSGTVTKSDGEECSRPAYGGESNTDGISEMGSIIIDLSDLLSADSIEEY